MIRPTAVVATAVATYCSLLLLLLLLLCDSARETVTIMMCVSVDSSWTDPGIV